MGTLYTQMLLNLSIVIALMVALLLVFKKVKEKKGTLGQQVKMLNHLSLGHKEKVILLEVFDKTLLIGATPTHIETLYVFGKDAAQKPSVETKDNTISNFANHLASLSQP